MHETYPKYITNVSFSIHNLLLRLEKTFIKLLLYYYDYDYDYNYYHFIIIKPALPSPATDLNIPWGKNKLGFNFFQINLFNEELRVFQIIISLVLPYRPLQP